MLLVPPGPPEPSMVLFAGMFWNSSPGLPITSQNQDSSSSEIMSRMVLWEVADVSN